MVSIAGTSPGGPILSVGVNSPKNPVEAMQNDGVLAAPVPMVIVPVMNSLVTPHHVVLEHSTPGTGAVSESKSVPEPMETAPSPAGSGVTSSPSSVAGDQLQAKAADVVMETNPPTPASVMQVNG